VAAREHEVLLRIAVESLPHAFGAVVVVDPAFPEERHGPVAVSERLHHRADLEIFNSDEARVAN